MPPDTNYGEAWEGLCCALLTAERPSHQLRRVASPDHGIDIIDDSNGDAFQCKAAELGAAGTMSAAASIESLTRAIAHRESSRWNRYTFATNGRYTATAREEIIGAATSFGLCASQDVDFLGPEYWEQRCVEHYDVVKDRFYYRVTLSELDVLDALRKARYYPQHISDYAHKIQNADYRIIVTNNRTPVELDIPFSPELTVENCLDASKELLGVSLEHTSFSDLNTSAGPSISLTIERHAQPFSKKLGEIGIKSGDAVEFWIKIVWRDGSEDATPSSSDLYMALRYAWTDSVMPQSRDRGQITVARKEALLQAMIWRATSKLTNTTAAHRSP